MLKVGTKAPIFKAESTRGYIDLQDYVGKQPIVLIFYPKDDSMICTKQLCAARDSRKQCELFNALVLGINPSTLEEHQSFANKFLYDFPLVSDDQFLINQSYQVGIQLLSFMGQHRIVYAIDLSGNIVYARKGNRPTTEIIEALKSI